VAEPFPETAGLEWQAGWPVVLADGRPLPVLRGADLREDGPEFRGWCVDVPLGESSTTLAVYGGDPGEEPWAILLDPALEARWDSHAIFEVLDDRLRVTRAKSLRLRGEAARLMIFGEWRSGPLDGAGLRALVARLASLPVEYRPAGVI
jgi:hypothetical protein